MKLSKTILPLLLLPSLLMAAEPNKGTVIMISSVSGWLLISSCFLFAKEIKRSRNKKS